MEAADPEADSSRAGEDALMPFLPLAVLTSARKHTSLRNYKTVSKR